MVDRMPIKWKRRVAGCRRGSIFEHAGSATRLTFRTVDILPRWWDRGRLCRSVPVPASHNVHPEFGLLCPTPRFRRRLRLVLAGLVVAGLGAGVMAATGGSKPETAANRVDAAYLAGTVPAASIPPSSATAGSRTTVVAAAPTAAEKPACVGDTRSEATCLAVKLRKPRMVRVATDRPAIAAVAIGRSSAPATGMIEAPLSGAGASGAMAKASEAEVAAASATGSEKSVTTAKKPKKTASRQNRRRDPYWYGAPSWREVEYQRGGYGRGGYGSNFW
jgi:hypothetical protein